MSLSPVAFLRRGGGASRVVGKAVGGKIREAAD